MASSRRTNNDDDNSSSYSGSSDEESSVSTVPHASRAVRAVMSMPASAPTAPQFEPAGARSVIAIEPLRQKRKERGYYADDGLAVPRGLRKKAGGGPNDLEDDPDAAYSTKFIDDYVEREKLLRADPFYRFLESVTTKKTISLLIDETAMSAATAERVRQAKAEYERQRRRAIDSPAEQDRLKRSRDQLDAATTELAALNEQRDAFEAARTRLIEAFRVVISAAPSNVPRLNVTATFKDLFSYFTAAACARYGAAGYRRTANEMRDIAEILHAAVLQPVGNSDIGKELKNAMPQTSYTALLLAALFIIAQNSALLERLRACDGQLFADAAAEYNRRGAGDPACPGGDPGATAYGADLVALANLLFDNNKEAKPTDNLLTLGNISQLLWAHLNQMLARAKSAQAPIARPTSALPAVGGPRTKSFAGIQIQFEVSDEDAVRAAGGEDVVGVSQEKLAEARRKLYRNEDRARSQSVLIELLEPAFRVCYPALFYVRDALFDLGYEPLAIGGGYADGEVVEVFGDGTAGAPQRFASVALLQLSETILTRSLVGQGVEKSDAAAILSALFPWPGLVNAVVRVMNPSTSVVAAYRRRVVERALRRSRAVDAFAQYAVAGTALFVLGGGAYTKSELETLSRYSAAARENIPATTTDAKFVAAENAAAAILANSRPIPQAPISGDQLGDALTTSERYIFTQAASPTNTDALDQRKRMLEERVAALQEQYTLLNKRLIDELKLSEAEGMEKIESILRGEFLATPGVALAPRNSGVIVLTTLAVSLIADGYQSVQEFIPCVAAAYSDDDLIVSDDYYVQFARLLRTWLRTDNVDDPDTWQPNRTETRARVSRASALNALRAVARSDLRVRHFSDARCTCFGFGERAGTSRRVLPRERDNWPLRGL